MYNIILYRFFIIFQINRTGEQVQYPRYSKPQNVLKKIFQILMFHKIKSSRSTSEQANIRPSRDKPLLSFLLSPLPTKILNFI